MTDILIRRGNLDIDMCTGRVPCGSWDMSQDKEPPDAGGEAGTDFPQRSQEGSARPVP